MCPAYSSAIRQWLLDKRNGPAKYRYNAVGEVTYEVPCQTKAYKSNKFRVKILLSIEDGVVREARYDAFGEPPLLAACAWCVNSIRGWPVADVVKVFTTEAFLETLRVSPETPEGRACLAASQALAVALSSYSGA